MSDLPTLEVLRNAISSLGSGSGHTLLGERVGLTTDLSGQDHARANLSARQAKAAGSLMSGTYGPPGTISSESAVLQRSLESRLRQQTGVCGSTLYRLTWKESATPSGRPLLQQQAMAHRRYVEGHISSGWTTPLTADWNASRTSKPQEYSARWMSRENSGASLAHEAQHHFAGWHSPTSSDGNGGKGFRKEMISAEGKMADGSKVSVGLSAQSKWQDPETRKSQGHTVGLQDEVTILAPWPTPAARDWKDGAAPTILSSDRTDRLTHCVQQIPGPIQSMFSGETVASGQLNPEHSRWLMGLPPEWSYCMAMAMPSSPRKRKGSYVLSLKAKLRNLEFMCIRLIGLCE